MGLSMKKLIKLNRYWNKYTIEDPVNSQMFELLNWKNS